MARSWQVIEGGTAESPVPEVKDAEKSFISGTRCLVHSIQGFIQKFWGGGGGGGGGGGEGSGRGSFTHRDPSPN